MFDVGFWELALIALVALVVIGPERLPGVVRTVGLWVGRGRRLLSNLKTEIDREIRADEMKEALQKQMQANPLGEAMEDTKGALRDIQQETDKLKDAAKQASGHQQSASAKQGHDSD